MNKQINTYTYTAIRGHRSDDETRGSRRQSPLWL